MSIKVLSACLLVAIASIGLYFISDPPEQVPDMQITEAALEPAEAREHLEAQHLGSTSAAGQAPPAADVLEEKPEKVGDGSREIPINLDEGEYDPGIIALAKEAGATPRCRVEELRAYRELLEYMETNPKFNPMHDKYEYANPVSEECKQESRARLTPKPLPLYEVSNTAYEQYTNEQLEALAPYEADAAILLARRIEDDRTSRAYYDLATRVTQDAKPLDEWLLRRGSVEYNNDVFNVEPARLGYETALIAEAFGSELSNTTEMYRDALVEEDVDLTPIEASARERIAELKGSN
jgi:hypothetical protein